jgi:hypothetical protein
LLFLFVIPAGNLLPLTKPVIRSAATNGSEVEGPAVAFALAFPSQKQMRMPHPFPLLEWVGQTTLAESLPLLFLVVIPAGDLLPLTKLVILSAATNESEAEGPAVAFALAFSTSKTNPDAPSIPAVGMGGTNNSGGVVALALLGCHPRREPASTHETCHPDRSDQREQSRRTRVCLCSCFPSQKQMRMPHPFLPLEWVGQTNLKESLPLLFFLSFLKGTCFCRSLCL